MPSHLTYHQLTVSLSTKDRHAYLVARRALRRVMGAQAPDIATLVEHNLRGRDASGLAQDYLSSVGWPVTLGHRKSCRRVDNSKRAITLSTHRTLLPSFCRDPRRN